MHRVTRNFKKYVGDRPNDSRSEKIALSDVPRRIRGLVNLCQHDRNILSSECAKYTRNPHFLGCYLFFSDAQKKNFEALFLIAFPKEAVRLSASAPTSKPEIPVEVSFTAKRVLAVHENTVLLMRLSAAGKKAEKVQLQNQAEALAMANDFGRQEIDHELARMLRNAN